MRVLTTVRKRGRRVSLIDVELTQGDRTAVRAAVTLGDPEHHVPPLLSVNPVVPLMTPEPPPDWNRSAPVTRWPTSCIWPTAVTSARR